MRRKHKRRNSAIFFFVVGAVIILSLQLRTHFLSDVDVFKLDLLNARDPVSANTLENDQPAIQTGEIESGESFYDLMKKHGVEDIDVLMMTEATKKTFNLHKISTGHFYKLFFDDQGEPVKFEYDINRRQFIVLTKDLNEWSVEVKAIDYRIREQVVQGVIKNSLYLSLVEECASTTLAVNLADIFAWDIDFSLDLREGDSFGILYEERWRDDHYVGLGRILSARFINQGKTYDAVYYKTSDGHSDYFDASGYSLQKQFLKSPLQFKYISSYFSKNRLHPILKIRRPHLGIDYAAPRGTPVRAAADGRVVFKGRDGGMGKMIKIRHNRIYTTAYGHLARYAKRIKSGKTVKQGEIIGYVGSTGLSTGPHLHYSFYRYGKLVNPMRIKNPKARSVPPSDLPDFKAWSQKLLHQIEPPSYEILTMAVGQPKW